MNIALLLGFIVPVVLFIALLIFLALPIGVNENDKKRLNIARVITVLLPGLGHVFMGSMIRGVLFIIIWISLAIGTAPRFFLILSGAPVENPFINVFMLPLIIWLAAIIGLSGWRKKKPFNSTQETKSL